MSCGPSSRTYTAHRYISIPFVHGLFRLEAQRARARARHGGFVLAANHASNLDPWPVGLPLFPKRWLRFMAKSELYWWPFTLVLDGAGAFKVRRGEGDVEAIETAVDLVRAGEIVVMFPEGTRNEEGNAEDADRAPAHRRRADRAPGRRAARPGGDQGDGPARAPGKWEVAYGEPFEPGDDAQAATERLMREIERLYETL